MPPKLWGKDGRKGKLHSSEIFTLLLNYSDERESWKFFSDLKHFHFFGKVFAEADFGWHFPAAVASFPTGPTKCIDSGVLWDCVFLDVLSLCHSQVLTSNFRSLHNDKGLSTTLRKCKWKLPLLDPLRPTVLANKDSLCNSPLKVAVGGQEKISYPVFEISV